MWKVYIVKGWHCGTSKTSGGGFYALTRECGTCKTSTEVFRENPWGGGGVLIRYFELRLAEINAPPHYPHFRQYLRNALVFESDMVGGVFIRYFQPRLAEKKNTLLGFSRATPVGKGCQCGTCKIRWVEFKH